LAEFASSTGWNYIRFIIPFSKNHPFKGTPGSPYDHRISNFNKLEANMRLRRKQVQDMLSDDDEHVLSITTFPRLGTPNFTFPAHPTNQDGIPKSLFYVDEAIFLAHPRFQTLTKHIRDRRQSKVVINVPVFVDKNTPRPFIEDLEAYGDGSDPDTESKLAAKPDHIYMDAMGFGMGCSCLQMTFQVTKLTRC
jgi:glutamate--cysteine ligase catalytic subunit